METLTLEDGKLFTIEAWDFTYEDEQFALNHLVASAHYVEECSDYSLDEVVNIFLDNVNHDVYLVVNPCQESVVTINEKNEIVEVNECGEICDSGYQELYVNHVRMSEDMYRFMYVNGDNVEIVV